MLRKISIKSFKLLACFLAGISLFSVPLKAEEKPPLLIYNQFPRIWNMDFTLMIKHLPKIKKLGFNAVWINPFMKTSKHNVVLRKNKATKESVKSIRSLYGMFDPSLTDTELYTELSTGNPLSPGNKVSEITTYTNEAKALGLVPMFDLVLNHVSRDSPLVAGTFEHFIKLGIDTSEWFHKSTDSKWNDIVSFNYDKERNIELIFETLWEPFIYKMIKIYGFSGVRIDFATGPKVCNEIIKKCIEYIKKLEPKAVIFAEDLYPGSKEDRITHVLSKSKDVGFTHVTNISMYLPENRVGNKANYESVLENLGLKKLMTHATTANYRAGTIGFPGSHDAGTALQMARKTGDKEDQDPLLLVKKRMAFTAFTSDAGWYLLAGDEILSNVTKSPFVRQNNSSFDINTIKELYNLNFLSTDIPICKFIISINNTFNQLRSANEVFWFEIFYSADKNYLYFVRHLGEGSKALTDIVTVNLSEKTEASPTEENILNYLKKQCSAEIDSEDIRYFYVQ